MKKENYYKAIDLRRYKKLLKMQDQHKKEFFDVDGCGIEIEFGVVYEYRCRKYVETGLKKIKDAVGNYGKFVPDRSIGRDLDVEIVLIPLEKQMLKGLFLEIQEIIEYYENFIFDDFCGIHANFRASDALKRYFYEVLVSGGYDSSRFSHTKYKTDFMDIVRKKDGTQRSYDEYVTHQKNISAKYAGVNFLKDNLVEFRTLDLNWDDIEYVIDLFEEAKRQFFEREIAG